MPIRSARRAPRRRRRAPRDSDRDPSASADSVACGRLLAPVLAARESMTTNTILIWLVVGLVAGVLASLIVRGSGLGIVGDILLGIAGAFVGGWAFHALGW